MQNPKLREGVLSRFYNPRLEENKPDKNVDVDNLPLHIQEIGLELGRVSEFERGLALILTKKKDAKASKKRTGNVVTPAKNIWP